MKKTAWIASVVLLTGCISSSDFKKLETQVTDLQDELSDLRKQSSSKEDVQKLNTNLGEQTDKLVKNSTTLQVKVGELDDKVQNMQGSLEQTNYRIDRMVQQVSQVQKDVTDLQNGAVARSSVAPTSSTPVTSPSSSSPSMPGTEMTVRPPSPSEDPLLVYQAAYKDYQRGNYDLAIEGFADFAKKNPNSDLADNASYWVGESLFSQKKYGQAVEQFNRVINGYPKSDKIPAALLKKGYAYIELNEKAQGIVQLQYVIHEHPRSQEASLAKQKLKALGIESK